MTGSRDEADPAATVIAEHGDELRSFLHRRTGSADAAGDLLQDLYLRLRNALTEQALRQPRAYAFRVAANLAADHGRREQRRQQLLDEAAPNYQSETDAATPDRHVDQSQRLRRVAAAVERMPPRCQTVFRLRKVEHLTQAEIAQRLGISQSMVEKHLRRALAYCREALDE